MKIVPASGFSENDILQLAASLESASEHPLADAIVNAAKEKNIALSPAQDFHSPVGKGVTGKIGDKQVALGNASFLKESGIDTSPLASEAETLRQDGATAIFIAVEQKPAGILAIADPVKPSTVPALKALRDDGIRIVMLTGDNKTTAQAVAAKLGIDDIEAEVLPEDKHQVVRRLRGQGKVVAMAGDGVNDAPALAEADIGIAMGTGTEVAIQSAGVTLVKGDLAGIARCRV